MAVLLSLAPELIQTIGSKLDANDVKALRLTCKQVSDVLVTEVLRLLTINFDKHNAERELHKLRILATSPFRTTRGIKTLNLESLSPGLDPDMAWSEEKDDPSKAQLEEPIKVYLYDALSSLASVRTVRWKISQRAREWSLNAVAHVLSKLPNLHTLDVNCMDCRMDIPFHMFQGLRQIHVMNLREDQPQTFDNVTKMIAQSPQLNSLSVYDHWEGEIGKASLHELFQHYPSDAPPLPLRSLAISRLLVRLDEITLPHLRQLTSLYINDMIDPNEPLQPSRRPHDVVMHQKHYGSSYEEIWTMIFQAGLQLEEITIQDVCPAFLDYLGSYSGLKKLCLTPDGFQDRASSNRAASRFYESLGKHTQSLEEIDICARYEDAWCIHNRNPPSGLFSIFPKCPNLKALHVKVHSRDLVLGVGHGSFADMDIIKVLIDTAVACTPHLEELYASVPDPESNRNADMPSESHSMRYTKQIITSLKAYRAPPCCKRLPTFTLSAGYIKSFSSQAGIAPGERLRYKILPSDLRDWVRLQSIIDQLEEEDDYYDDVFLGLG